MDKRHIQPMTRSTKRTPEELAAFKAANKAAAAASREVIVIEPRQAVRKFTVTWTTDAGQFGWFTTKADTVEDAATAFVKVRGRGSVPSDASIELIERGGQEL